MPAPAGFAAGGRLCHACPPMGFPSERTRSAWMGAGAALALALTGCLTGCIKDTRIPKDRGASNLYDSAPEVAAPLKSRCAALTSRSEKRVCEESRATAQGLIRRLSTGEMVCLQGGVAEPPRAACQARAFVEDTAPDKVLLEIRDAKPDSRWFQRLGHQIWFAEEALVDLYLAERGY